MNQHNSRYCVCSKVDNGHQHICCVCLENNPDMFMEPDETGTPQGAHYHMECYDLPYDRQLARRAIADKARTTQQREIDVARG